MSVSEIPAGWPRRFLIVLGVLAFTLFAALLWLRTSPTSAAGGTISGTVTDENTGVPLEDICVDVVSASHELLGYDVTDASGHYYIGYIGGLLTGDYKVRSYDCASRGYLDEWYDDQPDADHAALVAVTVNEDTAGIDAALVSGGSVSGTVTSENTGEPLENVCVSASAVSYSRTGFARTDAGGRYAIEGLRADDYKVRFADCNSPRVYAPEWYDDRPDRDSASPVTVIAEQETAGIHAALAVGGTVNGTVTDESTGEPLEDICVYASGASPITVHTDASGNYEIGGLSTGLYAVDFYDCRRRPVYFSEWYNDRPDAESADLLAVTLKEKISGIDAALRPRGIINGTVTDETTGEPLLDICVQTGPYVRFGPARSDASGRYALAVAPGDYIVRFYDCGGRGHLEEWYNDQPGSVLADAVTVVETQKAAGIDASLTLGGSISGVVTDENTGEPLEGICASASWPSSGSAGTDASGNYEIRGLSSGLYTVRFRDCNYPVAYLSEWYNDRPDSSSADLVAVTEKTKTAGIDAALTLGGSINGTVTDENTGAPLEGICVQASGASSASAVTDTSGRYSLLGLSTGDHKVRFSACTSPQAYLSEWYNDRHDTGSADLVAVREKEKTAGINAALTLGGSISGTVTHESTGLLLGGVRVSAYDSLLRLAGSANTDAMGNYTIGGLPAGGYKIKFEVVDYPSAFLTEWYNDRSSSASADVVTVGAKEKTPGIDAALAGTGLDFSIEVAGTLCNADGGAATCDLELGSAFTLNVYLNSLPTMISEYGGMDVILEYAGMTSQDNADISAYWPACVFEVSHYEPGLAAVSCAAYQDRSAYLGLIATIDFNCGASGIITLRGSGEGDTAVYLEPFTYREGVDKTLTINCVELPPTPTPPPQPTPTPRPAGGVGVFPPAGLRESGGASGAAGLALPALAAGAVAVGGAAWYATKRRTGR